MAGRYCPGCGQDNAHRRLMTRTVLSELAESFAGWDSALGRTLRGLAWDPGRLSAEYVGGRRRRFVNPAKLCLMSLALWLLLSRILGIDALSAAGINMTFTDDAGDSLSVTNEAKQFLSNYLEALLVASLPVYALLLRAAFRRALRNWAEVRVLVLYLGSFQFLLAFLLTPLGLIWPAGVEIVRGLAVIIWTIRAVKTFFVASLIGAIWRVLVCKILHVIVTAILFGGLAAVWLLVVRGV